MVKKELLIKLKVLSERGTPAEQKMAYKKLVALCEKYDIDEDSIFEEEVSIYEFKYHGKLERKLLFQIMACVLNEPCVSYSTPVGRRETIRIRCTKVQFLKISADFNFYKKLFEEECELFFKAFLYKQDLFPARKATDEEREEPTSESRENLLKIVAMSDGITRKSPMLMIEEGNTDGIK